MEEMSGRERVHGESFEGKEKECEKRGSATMLPKWIVVELVRPGRKDPTRERDRWRERERRKAISNQSKKIKKKVSAQDFCEERDASYMMENPMDSRNFQKRSRQLEEERYYGVHILFIKFAGGKKTKGRAVTSRW